MSVENSYQFPSYFRVPIHRELASVIGDLDSITRSSLERNVYELATAEGVKIEGWDCEWGKHHLLDSDGRLIAAFLEWSKAYLQAQTGCSKTVADLMIRYCPRVQEIRMDETLLDDLVLRTKLLSRLEDLKGRLNAKYGELNLFNPDSSEARIRGWKAQETFLLTLPDSIRGEDIARLTYFTSVIEELVDNHYDPVTVVMILDRLLERVSLRPTSSNLESHAYLNWIKNTAERQIAEGSLSRADESLCKDIFVVPSASDKQGKLKPLHPRDAAKEVYGYHCDRLLAIGMTAPTMMLRPGAFAQRVDTIRKLFESAILLKSQKNDFDADRLRQRAFALLQASNFPSEVRNSIFSEMYLLCGNNQWIDQLGEKLFFDQDGQKTTDRQKERAIRSYMESEAFRHHQDKFGHQGSVQVWMNNCARSYDYIVKDTEGGSKLKTAHKTLVHFYTLLGIIKGSMDCSSGNTLVEFDNAKGEVSNFWDMDDERSMPETHDFWKIRLWQMGLPQSAQPFDRAFLLLFSDPRLLAQFKKLHSSNQILSSANKVQYERLEKIIALFKAESEKATITLTPRELFYTLFGGREDFDSIKQRFNDDKSCGEEGIRISPIELFEFHLPEMGRTAWYTGDSQEATNVGANMRALYYPELP